MYCDTGSDEHEAYGKTYRKIINRSELDEELINNEIDEESTKEYQKRVKAKLEGKEVLDKTLIFYRIFGELLESDKSEKELVDILLDMNSKSCIESNILYLEKAGFIELKNGKYTLNKKIKKLFIKIKV